VHTIQTIDQVSSIKIGSSSVTGIYQWNTGATTDSIIVNAGGIWVRLAIHVNRIASTISVIVNVELGVIRYLFNAVVLDGSTYLWV
jgi:hypothetical protein